MARLNSDRYWFPAKRRGWGWGPPQTWQGRVVLVVWIGILVAAGVRLLPTQPLGFAIVAVGLALLLSFVCYITGEPPRWRWDDKTDD